MKSSEFDVDICINIYDEQALSRELCVHTAGFDDATNVVYKPRQKHALVAGLSFGLFFIRGGKRGKSGWL